MMKTYSCQLTLALLTCVAATACDVESADPDAPTAAAEAAGKADGVADGVAADIVFSRDARPVDGALSELRIESNGAGTYDVRLHTASFDRIAGQEVSDTEVIATDLWCEFDLDHEVVCARDDRPVDGALVVVQVSRGDDELYNATLQTSWFDRFAGQEVHETRDLAFALALEQDIVTFERDARPVDGALRQISLAPTDAGYDVLVRTAYIDRIQGQEVDVTDVVASGLTCDFSAVIVCERDDLPVDGTLVELVIEPGKFGGFDATLATSWHDRFAGEFVTETDVLGFGLQPV